MKQTVYQFIKNVIFGLAIGVFFPIGVIYTLFKREISPFATILGTAIIMLVAIFGGTYLHQITQLPRNLTIGLLYFGMCISFAVATNVSSQNNTENTEK